MPGFADTHNHQFANLGFGGRMFWGSPIGPLQDALGWCTRVHGAGGALDLAGYVFNTFIYDRGGTFPGDILPGHLVGGFPQFDGWPRWDSTTHQSVHADWLLRAVQGGLRLLVMLAVNNEALCGIVAKTPGRTCRDMEAADLQLRAARQMESDIDSQSGGAGLGWYRIVETPQEAASVIAQGKLAVVLGIEVDYLFDSYPESPPSEPELLALLDAYFALGVRHIFPIHFANNAFGGTAFDKPFDTDPATNLEFGALQSLASLSPIPLAVAGVVDLVTQGMHTLINTVDGSTDGYRYRGGRRNGLGLTALGKFLVREAMQRGMVVDVDHMSAQARADALDIAEELEYPVISGHSGFVEISNGDGAWKDKRSEGNLRGDEVERIRKVGGMVSVILHQGDLHTITPWTNPPGTLVPHTMGNTSETLAQAYLYAAAKMRGGPVAFGTDFNGFAGLPRPRFGPDAPSGDQALVAAAAHTNRLRYPFVAASGATMQKSVAGIKIFDLNDDSVAHVGMLPDLIAEFANLGMSAADLEPLVNSADGYVAMWRKAWINAGIGNLSRIASIQRA